MKKNIISLVFGLFLVGFWSNAQTTIQGNVTDSSGTSLSGVLVTATDSGSFFGLSMIGLTDSNGDYDFPFLSFGSGTVVISVDDCNGLNYSLSAPYSFGTTVTADFVIGCASSLPGGGGNWPGGGTGGGGNPGGGTGGGGCPGGGNGGGNWPGGGWGGFCTAQFFAITDTTLDVQFMALTFDSTMNFSWDFGDGNSASTMDPAHSYTTAGTYNVCLIVSDSSCADTICKDVVVPHVPGSGWPGGGWGGGPGGPGWPGGGWGNGCHAHFFAHRDSTLSVDFYSFSFDSTLVHSWDFGDGNTGSGMNPSHTYSVTGTYTVCLIVQDTVNACADTTCKDITVPHPWSGWPGGGWGGGPGGPGWPGGGWGNGCHAHFFAHRDSTLSVDFYSFSLDSTLIHSWDFGDGNSGTGLNPSHTYAVTGTYTVCLIVQDTANACADTTCKDITVPHPWSGWPGGGWGGGPGWPGGGWGSPCLSYFFADTDTTLDVDFYSVLLDSNKTYSWDFGDGNSSTLIDPSHTYSAAGTYTVCLIVSDSLCSDTTCMDVEVPMDSLICGWPGGGWGGGFPGGGNTGGNWPGGPGGGFPGGPGGGFPGGGWGSGCDAMFIRIPDSVAYGFYFLGLSLDTSLTYSWSFGDGSTDTGLLGHHVYAGAGTYEVCLTVTDPNTTCTDTYCDSLTIVNLIPGGGGNIQLGIEEVSLSEVKLYPNPTSGLSKVEYQLAVSGEVELEVTDLSGRILFSEQMYRSTGTHIEEIRFDELPAGTYLVRLSSGERMEYLRLIKQ
jgi:PKD repeat protein